MRTISPTSATDTNIRAPTGTGGWRTSHIRCRGSGEIDAEKKPNPRHQEQDGPEATQTVKDTANQNKKRENKQKNTAKGKDLLRTTHPNQAFTPEQHQGRGKHSKKPKHPDKRKQQTALKKRKDNKTTPKSTERKGYSNHG